YVRHCPSCVQLQHNYHASSCSTPPGLIRVKNVVLACTRAVIMPKTMSHRGCSSGGRKRRLSDRVVRRATRFGTPVPIGFSLPERRARTAFRRELTAEDGRVAWAEDATQA